LGLLDNVPSTTRVCKGCFHLHHFDTLKWYEMPKKDAWRKFQLRVQAALRCKVHCCRQHWRRARLFMIEHQWLC